MDLYDHEHENKFSLIIFQIFSGSSIQIFVHANKTWSYANVNTSKHAKGRLTQFKDCHKRPKACDFLI